LRRYHLILAQKLSNKWGEANIDTLRIRDDTLSLIYNLVELDQILDSADKNLVKLLDDLDN